MSDKPHFRTGKSIGQSILHHDGRLFYMAPSVQAAELMCKALNALVETGYRAFPDVLSTSSHEEPPQFNDLVEHLKDDANALYPNAGFDQEEAAQKQAFQDAVNHIMNNLLMRGLLLIDPKSVPVIHPTDEEIEESAIGMVKAAAAKGNFMDGLAYLVNAIRQWKRRGKIEIIPRRPVDIYEVLFPVICSDCESRELGLPCEFCLGKGERPPNIQEIRERLIQHNQKQ